MNVIAWILQVLLAILFVFHGILYLAGPEPLVARMRQQGGWPPSIPTGFRRFIGGAEILGAIALIGPSLIHVLPWLTPLAALLLAFVTASASVYHVRRHEPPIPLVVTVLCLVVVYLRWVVVPIT
jgi:uncharacterized membrane protein YphA (DoxX/SURF4 family)